MKKVIIARLPEQEGWFHALDSDSEAYQSFIRAQEENTSPLIKRFSNIVWGIVSLLLLVICDIAASDCDHLKTALFAVFIIAHYGALPLFAHMTGNNWFSPTRLFRKMEFIFSTRKIIKFTLINIVNLLWGVSVFYTLGWINANVVTHEPFYVLSASCLIFGTECVLLPFILGVKGHFWFVPARLFRPIDSDKE